MISTKQRFQSVLRTFTPWLFSHHSPTELLISRRCWVFPYIDYPQVPILSSTEQDSFKNYIKLMNMAYMVFQLLFHTFWLFPSITPRLFRHPHPPSWLLRFGCFQAPLDYCPTFARRGDFYLGESIIFSIIWENFSTEISLYKPRNPALSGTISSI